MSKSRTIMVAKNIYASFIFQIIGLMINFINRTIFIRILGIEYLGINGLFTNVLTILSFAELGIGNAIIFNMYAPLASRDYERLKSLINFYKNIYRFIALTICTLGLLFIPFIGYLINDQIISDNIYTIYFFFLLSTTISYLFIHKKSIIIADQKGYIANFQIQLVRIIRCIIQIVILLVFSNYLLYLAIQVIFVFLENYAVSKKADKLYSFIKDKDFVKIKKEEKRKIFENVRALALYKIGGVALSGSSNILISILIGIRPIGLISNYMLVIGTLSMILNQITTAFTASIGNLNITATSYKKENVFNRILFIVMWIYGFSSIGLLLFLTPLITIWLGYDYTLPTSSIFGLVSFFYVMGVHRILSTYRIATGLFIKGRYAPIVAAILNIILSFILGRSFGLGGILVSPTISRFLTNNIVDPILIYKNVFESNFNVFFIVYGKYLLLFGAIYFLFDFILKFFVIYNLVTLVLLIICMTILFNIIMFLVFHKSEEFKDITKILKNTILSKI